MINPLSDKMSEMRTSLFQGLLDTANFNLKNGNPDTMFFEWGNVFEQKSKGLTGIEEKFQLAGVANGIYMKSSIHSNDIKYASFHLIKGIVAGLLKRLRIKNVTYNAIVNNNIGLDYAHTICVDTNIIGYIYRCFL